MKQTLLLLSLICFSTIITAQVKVNQNAANSAINTSSAFIDASSSPLWNGTTNQGKGMLYPRVDLVNYTAMSHAGPFNASNNPNYFDGLLVFNTATGVAGIGADSVFPGYYYYRNTTTTANGGHWVSLKGIKGDDGSIGPIGPQGVQGIAGNDGAAGVAGLPGATGPTGLLSSGTLAGNTPYWNGTNWILNGANFYNNGSNIGIGTTTPNASAITEMNSTNQGFLPPRMTTTQRNAIVSPASGLQIYNSTTGCLNFYSVSAWYEVCGTVVYSAVVSTLSCGTASITGTLTSGTAASGVSTSVPYTGGNGGTYAAHAVLSTGVTGLTANLSAGTLAVGAGNLLYTITGTPSSSGTASFAINIGGQTCTLNITVRAPLAIGQSYEGGIIAYLFQTGDPGYIVGEIHGLIVAPNDQGSVRWHNGSFSVTGAISTALGSGAANTVTIVAAQGIGSYAAQLCNDLILSGYSDWYLPSKDELAKLCSNQSTIGGFAANWYWSSSEINSTFAWLQNFSSGIQGSGISKGNVYPIRAVRLF